VSVFDVVTYAWGWRPDLVMFLAVFISLLLSFLAQILLEGGIDD
jgi:hypothetical protein